MQCTAEYKIFSQIKSLLNHWSIIAQAFSKYCKLIIDIIIIVPSLNKLYRNKISVKYPQTKKESG